MRLTGTIEIVLTDTVNGTVERISETNMITNVINNLFSKNPFGVFLNASESTDGVAWSDNLLPICPNMIGGILLFGSALSLSADNIYPASANLPIAYGSNDVNSTADTKRGSLNLTESQALSNGYKFVWDFTSSQGNGSIAALGLTSAKGGKSAYGNLIGDSTAFTVLRNSRLSSLSAAQMLVLMEAVEVDFENNSLVSICYENSSVLVKTLHIPITELGLNDRLDDSSYSVTHTEAINTATFHTLSSTVQYGQFFDGKDGYWYGFANEGNSSGDAELYWVKISKTDYSKTEGLWILSDANLTDVGNQKLETYPIRNCRSCIRSGYLYVMSYDKTGVYKININDSTDVDLISLGFTSQFKSLSETANSGLYMTVIGDIIFGCDFQILADDSVIHTAGSTRFVSAASPVFQYKNFLLTWGNNYSYRYRGIYLLTPYLASLNNLASPVVKTSDKTMKITYTLTESA